MRSEDSVPSAIELLEDQGVSDAELSAYLTAKSPRSLINLYLWKPLNDAMDHALRYCNLMSSSVDGDEDDAEGNTSAGLSD